MCQACHEDVDTDCRWSKARFKMVKNQIETLFSQAIALDGAEREGFLQTLPAEQREELESLLRADVVASEDGLFDSFKELPTNDLLDVQSGTDLGSYGIEDKLGEGGMGAVFRATHKKLKRTVALKILPQNRMKADDVARFEREMAAAGQLSHRHIVTAFDAGEADGHHFLAMELIDGVDLNAVCQAHGQLDVGSACEMIRQAAIGLQHAHENGMVHRDIKPSNLMLASGGIVKILDLGLARIQVRDDQEDLTSVGQMMGTLDYMAAEQGTDSHNVDIRADIYSLGVTLYKLLTGVVAYSGPSMESPIEKMMALANTDPPSVSSRRKDLPQGLATIVDRMICRNPDQRYSEPQEVVDALNDFADSSGLEEILLQTRQFEAEGQSRQPTVNSQNMSVETDANAATQILKSVVGVDASKHRQPQDDQTLIPSGVAKPQPAAWWKRPGLIIGSAVGVIALLWLAFPQVFSWPTKDGRIVVTVEGKEIEVTLKGNTGSFNDPTDQKPVKLTVDYDNNRVKFEKGGLKAWVQDLELTSPDGSNVSVRYERNSPAIGKVAAKGSSPDTNTAMSNEQLLEWAFQNGLKQVNVVSNGRSLNDQTNTRQFRNQRIDAIEWIVVDEASPQVIAKLQSINGTQSVRVTGENPLSDAIIEQLAKLPQLKTLALDCPIHEAQIPTLSRATDARLIELGLLNESGSVTDATVKAVVSHFPKLKNLSLHAPELTSAATESMNLKTPSLTRFVLIKPTLKLQQSLDQLTTVIDLKIDAVPVDLSHLPPHLQVFGCDGVTLTQQNYDQLIACKTLRSVVSRFGKVDKAAVAAFEAARPDCEFDSYYEPANEAEAAQKETIKSVFEGSNSDSTANLQVLDWAFENGVQYMSGSADGKLFSDVSDSSVFSGRTIETIDFVRLNTAADTPMVLEKLNSISPLRGLSIWGSEPLDDKVIQQLGRLQSLTRLGIYCQFDIDQLEDLPESIRRQISYLLLRNDDRKTPITDHIVAKAAKLFPNLTLVDFDCSTLSTASTISSLRLLPSLKRFALSEPRADLQRELKSLKKVTYARYLDIPATGITALPVNAETFCCDKYNLTAKDFGLLVDYHSLTEILLRYSEVDHDAVAAFKVARPDCTVTIISPVQTSTE